MPDYLCIKILSSLCIHFVYIIEIWLSRQLYALRICNEIECFALNTAQTYLTWKLGLLHLLFNDEECHFLQ